MLVTEERAKTKWCPHAAIDCSAANRPNPGNNCDVTAGWAPCVASDCMAWRWADPAPELRSPHEEMFECEDDEIERYRTEAPERPASVPTSWTWEPFHGPIENIGGGYWKEPPEIARAENAAKRAARKGFCGLAGDPQ